jgi:hypothetical protein
LANLADKVCDGKNCPNMISGKGSRKKHKEQLGGNNMKFGVYHKWKMPEKLVEYLLSALDEPEERFSFRREDYAVRNHFIKRIEDYFGKRQTGIVLPQSEMQFVHHFLQKMKML